MVGLSAPIIIGRPSLQRLAAVQRGERGDLERDVHRQDRPEADLGLAIGDGAHVRRDGWNHAALLEPLQG
jgi:hypothetical protein